MSHVIRVDSVQRCAQCGDPIEPGPMHVTQRSEVGVATQSLFWHEAHCPHCAERAGRPTNGGASE